MVAGNACALSVWQWPVTQYRELGGKPAPIVLLNIRRNFAVIFFLDFVPGMVYFTGIERDRDLLVYKFGNNLKLRSKVPNKS